MNHTGTAVSLQMAVLVCSDDRGATSQSCCQQPCGSFEVPARMEWCREARAGGEEYGTHFAFELLNVPNDFLLRQFRVCCMKFRFSFCHGGFHSLERLCFSRSLDLAFTFRECQQLKHCFWLCSMERPRFILLPKMAAQSQWRCF